MRGFSSQPGEQLHLPPSSPQPLAWRRDTGLTKETAVSERGLDVSERTETWKAHLCSQSGSGEGTPDTPPAS